MVDLHCHILPGIDDGPDNLEESVELCRAAHRDGTRTLVATPHVNDHYPAVTAAVIEDGTAALNRALRAAALEISVQAGAEVALSRVSEMDDPELERLTLGEGRYLLVELPWTPVAAGALAVLQALASRGYGIVVAHPERSPMLQRNQTIVAGLVASGVLCCLDVSSLADRADRRTRATAWGLLASGLVHAIASDCHDSVRRPPMLGSALEQTGLSPAEIDYFIREAPAAILGGEAIGPPPEVERSHRGWLRRRPR